MHRAKIGDTSLSAIRKVIRRELGLDIRPDSVNSFSDKIADAAEELGYESPESCIHSLVSRKLAKREIEVLASHLTIGETYFFREPKSFNALETHILPELVRSRKDTRTLRIWSAACASGEEPYSLAMLLMKMLPDWDQWRITILATDINTRFLGKAIKGRYTEWSFRTTPRWAKDRYFRKVHDRKYEISSEVRNLVTFSYLNLASTSYPSLRNNTNAMDLILCRNVLIYFGEDMRKHVIAGMHRSLVEGGCLLVSPVEASRHQFTAFAQESIEGISFYCRKHLPQPHTPVTAQIDTTERIDDSGPIDQEIASAESSVLEVPDLVPQPPQPLSREPSPETPKRGNYHHAEYLFKHGQYSSAVHELLFCKEQQRAQVLLARAYANLGDFDAAQLWCDTAIQANPLDPQIRYILASVLQEKGNLQAAVDALRKTIYLDQDFILAHYLLANMLLQMGNPGEARRHYRTAHALAKELPQDRIVPESDGLPAGRLLDLIELSIGTGT